MGKGCCLQHLWFCVVLVGNTPCPLPTLLSPLFCLSLPILCTPGHGQAASKGRRQWAALLRCRVGSEQGAVWAAVGPGKRAALKESCV